MEAMIHCQSVRRLVVNYCLDFTPPLLRHILEINPAIEKVTFVRHDMTNNAVTILSSYMVSLKAITIESCTISEDGIVQLANSVKSSSSLRFVTISGVKMSIKAFEYLADAISHSGVVYLHLQSLQIEDITGVFFLLEKSSIEKLECSGIPLSLEAMGTLRGVLEVNKNLRTLILNKCGITDAHLQKLSSLKGSPDLRNLFLEENEISNNGVQVLGQKLEDFSLRHLSLRRNKVGSEGFEFLCNFLRSNQTMETLDVRDNQIETTAATVPLFQANQILTLIQLRGNNISMSEQELLIEKGIESKVRF